MKFYPTTDAQEKAFWDMVEGYDTFQRERYPIPGWIDKERPHQVWVRPPDRSTLSFMSAAETPLMYVLKPEIRLDRLSLQSTCDGQSRQLFIWFNRDVLKQYQDHLRLIRFLADEMGKEAK